MTSPDFAAAHNRISARRQLQAIQAQTRLDSRRSSRVSAALSRLPFPLRSLGQQGIDVWDVIKGREGTRPAFRVGQVDAELLDEELLDLLNGQVGEGLKFLGSHLRDEWSSEILLALRAILFKFTIWDHNASYGASLQNLKYTDARHKGATLAAPSKWQKACYGLCTIGGRYVWTIWENWLAEQEGDDSEPSANVRLLSRLSSFFQTTHSVAAFASFLVFLINGRYRTLIDRILRLRLASPTNQVSRDVSFEYLNRQLVWHAFTEFLLFLLPLVGISRWRRWFSRAWRKTKALIRSSGIEEEADSLSKGEFSFLPERSCAICYQDQNPTSSSENEIMAVTGASGGVIGSAQTDVTNPYETIPCGCVYCFVCIATRLEAEEGEGLVCLRCGSLVKECRPWAGDVLSGTVTPAYRKTVTFPEEDETLTEPGQTSEDKRAVKVQEAFTSKSANEAKVERISLDGVRESHKWA